jgi:Zn-dependent metalloprotease
VVRSLRHALRLSILVATAALILVAPRASAALRTDLHRADVARLNHNYLLAAQGLGVAATARDRHAELLGLDGESRLVELNHRQDKRGTHYYRYQQTFRGLPVFGEQVVVAERGGAVRKLFGRKVSGLARALPVDAALIGKARALQRGRAAALGARSVSMQVSREQAREMVFVGADARAHHVYLVSFFADQPGGGAPTRPFVIVDAGTGAVLKQWDGLAHAEIGTGPGGNGKTGAYEYGLQFPKNDVTAVGNTCTMSNARVQTINMRGNSAGSTPYSYLCPRNTADAANGAYSPLNDAHAFGKAVIDMYAAYLGVAPLATQLTMRVHYGNNYQNAFWDGEAMTFGDGGNTYYPLVSLDLAAHEISHGFTQHNADLVYEDMSGAINESYSDMAGEAAEFHLRGSNDFLVGAQIVKAAGGALRSLADPRSDGQSIDHVAGYRSHMNVHYSSGVYNKAFYLLATTAGWDTRKAFQVFARANQLYWTPSITFNQGACGVLASATDLGYAKSDVVAAFAAVGVTCDAPKEASNAAQLYVEASPVLVSDARVVSSSIQVDGRSGNASATSLVGVSMIVPPRSQIQLTLVSPEGSSYPLRATTMMETGALGEVVYAVDLSREALAGTWTLQVQDKSRKTVTTLYGWSLEF